MAAEAVVAEAEAEAEAETEAETEAAEAEAVGNDGKHMVTARKRQQQR
jgi:hypothetical protein